MLRRLDLKAPWRSLEKGFWPKDLPFGKQTIIYGHNGSGKSTLSDLLLHLAESRTETHVIWEDESKHRSTIHPNAAPPSNEIAVFTRRWVEANLSAFLDGKNASAIVTLGEAAIEAQEKEKQLTKDAEKLRNEVQKYENDLRTSTAKRDQLVREVQDGIVSNLGELNPQEYTKNQYSTRKVRKLLEAPRDKTPDDTEFAAALKSLSEPVPSQVPSVVAPHEAIVDNLSKLHALLKETPGREALKELEGNTSAQSWVENGLALHTELHNCLFCSGTITSDRREKLARHFDESWVRIRSRAQSLLTAVSGEVHSLNDWFKVLPAKDRIASDFQSDYETAIRRAEKEVDDRVTILNALIEVLKLKVEDPSAIPEEPEWSLLKTQLNTAKLERLVDQHNQLARQFAEVTKKRKQTALDYLLGSRHEDFLLLEEEIAEAEGRKQSNESSLEQVERDLEDVRKSRFSSKKMADTLSSDLANIFGKDHLRITVSPDGNSYSCYRGTSPATYLSDGERMTLALLYFLRNLEDQQNPNLDPKQRIIVIDDPSSSLDREAVFATHQLLMKTLEKYGQWVVLTHDFNLLRLFLMSHKSKWNKSLDAIKKGDVKELIFPRIAFLEMYASSIDGERRSKIGEMPRFLKHNVSEYAYLFSMVMAGVAEPENHERLFLLPNAARRVIEIFVSYKAPHTSNFLQQLKDISGSQKGGNYRQVYDFCNRFSHGEGSESIDVLDARAISENIRQCMSFLRAVDQEHFERMCKATNTNPEDLPPLQV